MGKALAFCGPQFLHFQEQVVVSTFSFHRIVGYFKATGKLFLEDNKLRKAGFKVQLSFTHTLCPNLGKSLRMVPLCGTEPFFFFPLGLFCVCVWVLGGRESSQGRDLRWREKGALGKLQRLLKGQGGLACCSPRGCKKSDVT